MFALVLAVPVPQGELVKVAPLSPEQVREAVRWGASESELPQYLLKQAPTWTVNFDTPFLRVAQLARAFKKQGRQIAERHVPPGVIEPDAHV